MDEVRLEADQRAALGKKVGALRRAGITPIHVYGRGEDSLSLQADTYDLVRTLGVVGQTSPLTLTVGSAEHFVMVQHVHRHPVSERLLHVDLLRVSRLERVHASVPLHFEGESEGAREDGASLSEMVHSIEVEALPTDIPHEFTIDLSLLATPDSVIRAGDLELPPGVTLLSDPTTSIVHIVQHLAEAVEADAEGTEEGVAADSP